MELYAQYLRKSRADMEAEQHGAGETLARHKYMLDQLANSMGIVISKVYKEIVSGETISDRPVMQQLLQDVEAGMYKGVLVVEVERLARGDTIDQGIVSQTFKYSNTQIITPTKVYNPNDEFDEEYFEFGLFMSRREYKTINRRIQAGRIASVKEGKYPSHKAPFGYRVVKLQNEKGYTLEIIEHEADAVRKIFDMYVNKLEGATTIAHTLNALGYKPRISNIFSTQAITAILDNPVYAGYVTWERRKEVRTMQNGIVKKSRPRSHNYIKCKGRHQAIIDENLWEKAHELRTNKRIATPRKSKELTNPLCGLIYCTKCGHKMQRRPAGSRQPADVIMCPNNECNNYASYMSLIEKDIIEVLCDWIDKYSICSKQDNELTLNINTLNNNITALNKELSTTKEQLNNAYNFLERGIYTPEVFFERSAALKDKINTIEQNIHNIQNEILKEQKQQQAKLNFLPKVKTIVDCYWELDNAKAKNDMLKEVIDHIDYIKEVKGRGHEDDFKLTIYPIISK